MDSNGTNDLLKPLGLQMAHQTDLSSRAAIVWIYICSQIGSIIGHWWYTAIWLIGQLKFAECLLVVCANLALPSNGQLDNQQV